MKSLFLLISVFSQLASASVGKTVTVTGIITKFDGKSVTLSQRGQLATVPRDSIPKHFAIKVGNKVFAVLDGKVLQEEFKK